MTNPLSVYKQYCIVLSYTTFLSFSVPDFNTTTKNQHELQLPPSAVITTLSMQTTTPSFSFYPLLNLNIPQLSNSIARFLDFPYMCIVFSHGPLVLGLNTGVAK